MGGGGGVVFFFFQAEDGIRDDLVTGVQTCALPISPGPISKKRQPQNYLLRHLQNDSQNELSNLLPVV